MTTQVQYVLALVVVVVVVVVVVAAAVVTITIITLYQTLTGQFLLKFDT